MRTNTIPRHIYSILPHRIGQRVSVKCHDEQHREGKIHNMIGYNEGISYTMNVLLNNGTIVTTAGPEDVVIL